MPSRPRRQDGKPSRARKRPTHRTTTRGPSGNAPIVEGAAAAAGAPLPAESSAPPQPAAPSGRLRVLRTGERQRTSASAIRRDYGYVKGELLRIASLAGAIFAVLAIIALIRG